jgi:acetylglutamate kinase
VSATVAPAALTGRLAAAQGKARVLREALPWINRWAGRTLVVKYGGSALFDRPAGTGTFAADVALLHAVGVRVVVVHGAGPQISALARRRGLVPAFVAGRRVTDAAMLDVVRSALLDEANPQLVAALRSAGAPAAGVGREAGELLSVIPVPGLGLVGTVDRVAPGVVTALLDGGRVPVVAGIGRDAEGGEHNVNADEVAAAIAVALGADKVVYLTDVAGLYTDFAVPPTPPCCHASTSASCGGCWPAAASPTGWSPRWREPWPPSTAASPAPTCSTAASTTRCCWRSSPTTASARW